MRAAQTLSKWAVASALAATHLFALAQQPAALNFKQVYEAALEQDATFRSSRA